MSVVGLAVGLAIGIVAPAPAVSTPAPTAPASPQPGMREAPPAVGTCWSMTPKQWRRLTLTASPVACTSPHTAETVGEAIIPFEVANSGYGSEAVRAWASRACHTKTIRYVWDGRGTERAKARYADPMSAITEWFLPSQSAWGAGDRWVSCTGVSVNPAWRLKPRRGSVLSAGLTPNQCVDFRTWDYVECGAAVSRRLRFQVWIADRFDQPYPGDAAAAAAAAKACQRLAGRAARLGVWYVPGRRAWQSGGKWGYCALRGL